jgi:hypothetical protein
VLASGGASTAGTTAFQRARGNVRLVDRRRGGTDGRLPHPDAPHDPVSRAGRPHTRGHCAPRFHDAHDHRRGSTHRFSGAHGGILRAGLAMILVLSFGLALSWVSAAIGLTVRDVEATQMAGLMWTFRLTFTSSAFVPVDSMPGWLQGLGQRQPHHHHGRRCPRLVARAAGGLRRRPRPPLGGGHRGRLRAPRRAPLSGVKRPQCAPRPAR